MAQLKFYKNASAPTSAAEGAIWFDTTNHTIQVKTATGWDKYAGALNDATWSDNTLTITKHDGSSIALDFSDMASAASMKAVFTDKIGLNTDLGYTPVYTGNTNVKADVASAKAAIEAVIGDNADNASDNTIYGTRKYVDEKVDAINVVGDNQYIEVTTEGENGDTFSLALTKAAAAKLDSAKTTVNAKADGHVLVSVSSGAAGDTVTITENDIASAKDLSDVGGRVAAIEAVMGGDDADTTINKVSEIINFLKGIEEGTVAKDTFDAVTAHGAAITNLQNNTVNGKKISDNPVLAGSDVLLTDYTKQAASALTTADSINVALGKLEARVDAAAASGVQSIGGKAGSITLDTDASGEGNVKFAISDAGEISATVNIGATAEQGAKADSAVQVVASGSTNGTIAVDGTDVAVHGLGSAAYTDAAAYDAVGTAAAAVEDALTWVEFA